jgi:hypothetical protein
MIASLVPCSCWAVGGMRAARFARPLTRGVGPIAGLWTLQYLINKGQVSKDMEQSMYVTYLASQVCA